MNYRVFCNTDVPRLAALWRSLGTACGHVQPMSSAWLEQYVLAKPYFDRYGLWLAFDDQQLVGFAHVGFGPAADRRSLSHDTAVLSALAVLPRDDSAAIARELLSRCEQYAAARGAKTIRVGTLDGRGPFYLGLYGGSELPGVLTNDSLVAVYSAAGYEPCGGVVLLECDLDRLRPVMNRSQLQLRRQATVEMVYDPPAVDWWDACTLATPFSTQRFVALRTADRQEVARVTAWNMDPVSASRNRVVVGMFDLIVHETSRRQGWATFLKCEALKQLKQLGVATVAVQVPETNAAALGLYAKLGFEITARGAWLAKPLATPTPRLDHPEPARTPTPTNLVRR